MAGIAPGGIRNDSIHSDVKGISKQICFFFSFSFLNINTISRLGHVESLHIMVAFSDAGPLANAPTFPHFVASTCLSSVPPKESTTGLYR